MGRHTRTRAVSILAIFLLLGAALAGCSQADTGGDETTTTAADTQAGDDTAPTGSDDGTQPAEGEEPAPAEDTTDPADEPPADDGEGAEGIEEPAEDLEPSEVPPWVWVLAALILLSAIVWMASRSGASSAEEDGAQQGSAEQGGVE